MALYKDANVRNFLLCDVGVAIVDYDDLTLAPFGYDVAKLVVSAAMTFGVISERIVRKTLSAYNDCLQGCPATARCNWKRLITYAEMHDHLTRGYLHRNGYTHRWTQVRPWQAPLSSRSPDIPGRGARVGDHE